MPKPKVYVVDNESPNAFATGRNPQHAVVAVTTGIRRILTDRELRAVIGHEIGHVKNRDILTGTIAATIAGAISYLGRCHVERPHPRRGRDRQPGNVMIALAVHLRPYRRRHPADDDFPDPRVRRGQERRRVHPRPGVARQRARQAAVRRRNPPDGENNAGAKATSSLYIVNPFSAGGLGKLFSTHPPVEERIKRLEEMARNGIQAR